jgi:hypothetical protein
MRLSEGEERVDGRSRRSGDLPPEADPLRYTDDLDLRVLEVPVDG